MTRRQKRGEFSPIARALLDGPDYQRLSATARHAFLVLKVMFGPSGIEVHYPSALVATLEHTTGWPAKSITSALGELDGKGWVHREANIVWLVGHLLYHPGMSATNEKHRLGVQNHVAGLPRLLIVRRFIEAHAAYFTDLPDVLSAYPTSPTLAVIQGDCIATGMAIEGLSNHAVRSTQYEEPNTQTQNEELLCASDDAPGGDRFAEFWAIRPRRKGTDSRKAAERCWSKLIKAGEDPDVILAGAARYADHCDIEGKTGTPFVMQASRFLGADKHYLDLDAFTTTAGDKPPTPPLVKPLGEGLTEYGDLATGPSPNPVRLAALAAEWRQTAEGRAALAEWRARKVQAAPSRDRQSSTARHAAVASEYAAALGGQ